MASFTGDGKAIFMVFVGAIIVAVFLGSIGDSIFSQTNTISLENSTVTGPAVNGTLDLTGRALVGAAVITNATDGALANGTFIETVTSATTGLRTVQLGINDTGIANAAQSLNVSYTYEPDGYVSTSGGRGIVRLILIIGSLALVIFVIVVFIKDGSLGKLMGR